MSSETLTEKLNAAVADKLALSHIVGTSRVRIALDAFKRKGREATQQQRAFRREVTIANVCLMIAGVLSGLVLIVAPQVAWNVAQDAYLMSWVPVVIGVLTLALGSAAAFFARKVREAGRFQRWLTTRSGAETARSEIFATIAANAVSEAPQEALSALDLVNRLLLEDQRIWFRDRAAEHCRSSEKTAFWGGAGTALAFAGGSGAVIASFEPDQAWIAIFGVVGVALAAYAVSRERLRGIAGTPGLTTRRLMHWTRSPAGTTRWRRRSAAVGLTRSRHSQPPFMNSSRASAGSRALPRLRPSSVNWTNNWSALPRGTETR